MPSLEDKLSSVILGTIRSRKKKPERVLPAEKLGSPPPAKLREATFADFDGVMNLRRAAGWSADSRENWERLWHRNPALASMEVPPPIGWVLEAEGRVVGYLGNITLTYRYGDRLLTAATGSGLVAEPAYRPVAVSLNAAFYRQKSVDLYLTTTAIEAVGKISFAFKSLPLPQRDYGSILFWVLQPKPFANAVIKKLEFKPTLSRSAAALASVAIRSDRRLRHRYPRRDSKMLSVQERDVSDIGDDFRALWLEKLKEETRLLADRDPATLRWHFDIPGDTGAVRVFCCYQQAELLGYAIVRDELPSHASGLRRSIIADMLVKQDDPVVLRSLWVAAYDHAKQCGSHVFEVLGFPTNIRNVCSSWRPYLRKYPSCPFYYKASDPVLHQTLTDGQVWYATPFDGDTTLWAFGNSS
jgi:hypothetical protein